ncbi:DUF6470 family protein [Rummeliibacillus sp. NPDC094406]|uniref:DUF6470 family protein n=1 Tax=Rummeliibacillus sp. NPDC094406 TaxID=3364511 RepID=UPI003802D7F7
MKLDHIQIRTTDAKLDLNINKPVQRIEQPSAQQHIEQPAATLEIHSEAAKLFIDSSQAYRDLGLLTPKESTEQNAQEGQQKAMEGIARRVSEGDQMMDISINAGDAIQQIAESKAFPAPPQMAITWKPSVGAVKVHYQEGSLNINIQRHEPKIDVQIGKVVHDYTPGRVEGVMEQHPSVEITVLKANE